MTNRLHLRFGLPFFALAAAALAAASAGIAFARSHTSLIGTGVVVIETNLAYQNSQAAGTGIVLTSSGEILTNNHVINGATTIKVIVPGTGHTYTARVVGYTKTKDVALLQLVNASNLKTATLGDSTKLTVGDTVTALGNAGGTGVLTTATGKITGLTKTITAGDDSGDSERLHGLIETDAGVQPGDSGGPLENAAGEVIGMDTAASSTYGFQSVASTDAYAIPISTALSIVKQIEAGKATATLHIGGTAFLGVEVESPAAVQGYSGYGYGYGGYGSSSPSTTTSGALIAGVVANGAAAAAGLAQGDVITAIDGHTVTSASAVSTLISPDKPGTKITVTYTDQSNASHTVSVTLGSGPPQ